MFGQKTGFKTKRHQRSNFFGELIYLPGFMFFSKKPVSKLNLANGIFFWKINLFAKVYVFANKTGFNTKPRQWGIFLGN